MYGSPSEWQKAMTYHWVQKILNEYQDKKTVIIEGQVNLDFITAAFAGFNFQQYKIILVHCNNETRHKRLYLDRNQPELINDDMDKWAEFLKRQAIDKKVTILDTSLMDTNEMVDWFKQNSHLSSQANENIYLRRTARAIILNKHNQVLLLKIKGKPLHSNKYQDTQSFWITVGGELEQDETFELALQRELREEVGVTNPEKIELIAFGEHVLLWKGLKTKFVEQFYIVCLNDINLSNRNLTHEESIVIDDYSWWSLNDLQTTKEVIFPTCLPKLVNNYINHLNDWMVKKISLD
ncbi:MAG: NUDIX domain-containing protein [Gammaproteobacteria bacterium]|nr:NUDIX domain-containing protein [Gammaproteobacteria bacterium]MCW5583807.1 NUDIX domain-containing protein [Gammaproteobacteria bacterium]